MTTHPAAPVDHRDVAIGYDASPEARTALLWAAREAQATGRRLAIVTAVNPDHYGDDAGSPVRRRFLLTQGHRTADPAVTRLRREFPALDSRVVVRIGSPFTAVPELAREAAQTVLGVRHRVAASRLLLGSVTLDVLRRATAPVVLVPHHPRAASSEPGRGRVVAVIGPAAGGGAVDFAIATGRARGAPVAVIRALRGASGGTGDEEAFSAGLEAAFARARANGDLRLEVRSADTTVSGLLDLGLTDTDLLVIGNHEPGEHRHLLTDRAVAAVLDHPHCPVAVVPDTATRAAATSRAPAEPATVP